MSIGPHGVLILVYIKEKKFQSGPTRFSTSSHAVFIEKGRHLNIERNRRICDMCTGNMIENGFNLYFHCIVIVDTLVTYHLHFIHNCDIYTRFSHIS